jgi:hypothetical protein
LKINIKKWKIKIPMFFKNVLRRRLFLEALDHTWNFNGTFLKLAFRKGYKERVARAVSTLNITFWNINNDKS